MESAGSLLKDLRQFAEEFLAPSIKDIRGDIKRIDERLESLLREMQLRSEMAEKRLASLQQEIQLRSELTEKRLESFQQHTDERLESLRKDVVGAVEKLSMQLELKLNEDYADLRERVARLESVRPH